MEDPFASFIANCNYSSSQEDLFNHSLYTREDPPSPDLNFSKPYTPQPSTAAAADSDVFAGGGIVICSAPETPISDSVATPSREDFKTPPEESRRSSSEEPPPPPPPQEFKSPGVNSVHDHRALNVGTPDLGSAQEKNRSSKIVEVPSNGKVLVDCESLRVGGKRKSQKESPIPESSSRRIRVSDKLNHTPNLVTGEGNKRKSQTRSPIQGSSSKRIRASKLIDTPNLGKSLERSRFPIQESSSKRVRVSAKVTDTPNPERREEGDCLVKRKIEFQIEMEVNEKMNVESEEVETEVIEDSDEKSCDNDTVEISNLQQVQEEEEVLENEGNSAKDRSRQGRRELPSWARPKKDNREDDTRLNTENTVDDDDKMKTVLEVLALLAREQGPSLGSGDILEIVKRRGLTFPEPKWWHDDD